MSINTLPKIEITFSPAWWSAKYEMDFGFPECWQEPIRYTERDQEQRRLLFERFGDLGLGERDPKPNPLVGVEFGHRFMSAFWNCEVIYLPDQWPHATPYPDAASRVFHLDVPEMKHSFAVELAFRNAKILEDRYGKVNSAVNFGGPLNNAVSVLGEEIFALCASDVVLAQNVLRKMGEAVRLIYDEVECVINKIPPERRKAKDWGIGNCPVGQISPQMYQEVVLPVDIWFRNTFQEINSEANFNLHHCGIFHPYVEVYQKLHPTDIDVGPGTDLQKTRQAFPDARISAYFEPATLATMSRAQIDAEVKKMITDTLPVDRFTFIRAIEVGPELSDQTIYDLLTSTDRLISENFFEELGEYHQDKSN